LVLWLNQETLRRLHLAVFATMRPALDPAGHRVPRTKPTRLLHTWRPHRQRPFALVLHLHQHESSRNLHLQCLAKNQSTQRCQSLIHQEATIHRSSNHSWSSPGPEVEDPREPRARRSPARGASNPRARRSFARAGVWPSSEAEFRPRGRPTLERGEVSPEGALGPAACWAVGC
jgi:hypothetical protein